MDVITDFPERLKPGSAVFGGEEHRPLCIRTRRPHAGGLLVSFEDLNTPEQVGVLRNMLLYVSAADRPALPEGEYYHHQLLGLRVVGDDGQDLGRLAEILVTSANDIYVVRKAGQPDLLLPAIGPVVLNIDLEQRVMTVHVLEGL